MRPYAKGSWDTGNHMHIMVYCIIDYASLRPIKNLPHTQVAYDL